MSATKHKNTTTSKKKKRCVIFPEVLYINSENKGERKKLNRILFQSISILSCTGQTKGIQNVTF